MLLLLQKRFPGVRTNIQSLSCAHIILCDSQSNVVTLLIFLFLHQLYLRDTPDNQEANPRFVTGGNEAVSANP